LFFSPCSSCCAAFSPPLADSSATAAATEDTAAAATEDTAVVTADTAAVVTAVMAGTEAAASAAAMAAAGMVMAGESTYILYPRMCSMPKYESIRTAAQVPVFVFRFSSIHVLPALIKTPARSLVSSRQPIQKD
jgi:hypothetical protein